MVGPPRGVRSSMNSSRHIPATQLLAERASATLSRFLHLEAASGVVLLLAAAIALVWANSPLADSYHALWHTELSIALGTYSFSRSLHFWINEVLMTLFFLVVGMEIRRELHEGALSDRRAALLPVIAAVGGVVVPAAIFAMLNTEPAQLRGWAIPTATDIAFAVGVLALLGRRIPASVRVFLLALAIIDDVIAVLIIAVFYADGLRYAGFAVAAAGFVLTLLFQRAGIGSAPMYIVPGAIVWLGLLHTGAHPTLAGVVLGLMTPVLSTPSRESPLDVIARVTRELLDSCSGTREDRSSVAGHLGELRRAQRELQPPVVRVQQALHGFVAYGVMPLFALANAGVTMKGVDLADGVLFSVFAGVAAALLLGKPLGVIGFTWLAVRFGGLRLPAGVTWSGVGLIGLLAGIGFTMSIFVAMLAFPEGGALGAAKLGVLAGSLLSALAGLAWGVRYSRTTG